MKRYFLVLLTLFAFVPLSEAQQKSYYDGPTKKQRDSIATIQINELKDGLLLVRLQRGSKQIEALESAGKMAEAKDFAKTKEMNNLIIMRAITDHYTFSKVYFFYAEYSDEIQKGNWHGKIFDINKKDIHLHKPATNYYVLESANASMPNFNSSQIGFTMMNSNYEPLDDPFPVTMIKRIAGKAMERPYPELVQIYMQKLEKYYAKANRMKKPKKKKIIKS